MAAIREVQLSAKDIERDVVRSDAAADHGLDNTAAVEVRPLNQAQVQIAPVDMSGGRIHVHSDWATQPGSPDGALPG